MHRSLTLAAMVAAAVISAGALTACTSVEGSEGFEPPPVVVEEIAGNELARLTLSESAAKRLDIQTSAVESSEGGLVVPSAAVIIDSVGTYWVYTNPEPFVFVRHELRSVQEQGQLAFFESGPQVGTPVVITGVPELYGAEFGIGK